MKHKVIHSFSNYYSIHLFHIVLYHNYLHKSHFFPKCNYWYLGDIIISAKKKKEGRRGGIRGRRGGGREEGDEGGKKVAMTKNNDNEFYGILILGIFVFLIIKLLNGLQIIITFFMCLNTRKKSANYACLLF